MRISKDSLVLMGRYLFLALIIYFKIMLFHWCVFGELYTNESFVPLYNLFGDFFTKILMSLFLATTVFLSKRIWLNLLPLLFIDIWSLCNLVYYGANELFIDPKAMQLVGNMTGFWGSIFAFFEPVQLLFIFSTILFIVVDYFIPRPTCKYSIKPWLISMASCTVLCLVLNIPLWHRHYYIDLPGIRVIEKNWNWLPAYYRQGGIRYFIPFYNDAYLSSCTTFYKPYDYWSKEYVHDHSIVHYFMAMFIYDIFQEDGNIYMTDEEEALLLPTEGYSNEITPNQNLILVVVESLESWTIKDTVCGQQVMPNFTQFYEKNYDHIIRTDSLGCIIRHGVSGDGQMMINSGLLPITMGATCQFYGENTFPNFAHLFNESVIIAPSNTWNQKVMTKAYQYDQVIMPEPIPSKEEQMTDTLRAWLNRAQEPFCAMLITRASHVPYNYLSTYNLESKLSFPEGMPEDVANYLNCLHYTDECLDYLFNEYLTEDRLKNTTVIFTGDHIIFQKALLDAMSPYVSTKNYTVQNPSYVPLVIYSPAIPQHKTINADRYYTQADIFPTIIDLLGLSAYPWHGFGMNLNAPESEIEPRYSLEDAFRISEKLIKDDYFQDKKDILN